MAVALVWMTIAWLTATVGSTVMVVNRNDIKTKEVLYGFVMLAFCTICWPIPVIALILDIPEIIRDARYQAAANRSRKAPNPWPQATNPQPSPPPAPPPVRYDPRADVMDRKRGQDL